jgi:predicted Kef-type K+ transport protein
LLAAFFTLGVIVQVFLAGLGMLVNPSYFVWHETFAHVLEFVPLLMLLFGLGARLQKQTLLLTSLLIVLVAFQYVFLYLAPQLGLMTLRALHAVNALALFWLGMYLARTVWQHHLHHTLRQQELKEGKRVS